MKSSSDYADPTSSGDTLLPPPENPFAPVTPDWEDVGKGIVGRGAAGLAGWAETAIPAVASGGLGVSPLRLGDVQRKVEEWTGPFYQPKSLTGRYAGAVAEFAPSALTGGGGAIPRIVNTVIPALTSETAGQLTRGDPIEPWMRGAGGVLGGLAGAKAITPTAPPTAAWKNYADTLKRAGVPLSAGDVTGSNAIRWLETSAGDMPASAGTAQKSLQQKAMALDKAFTEKAFDPAALAQKGIPPDTYLPQQNVMAAGRETLSDTFNRLSAAHRFQSHPQLFQDFAKTLADYERGTLPLLRAGGKSNIEAIQGDIVDKLVAGRGTMSGSDYQKIRSDIGKMANSAYQAKDSGLGAALKEMRGSLDATMMRSLPPEAAAEWVDANRRWANMKQIERASATAGEHLSPAGIAASVRAGRTGQYAQGKGDLDELAKAASVVLKPLPQSGTAPRTMWQNLANIPASIHAVSAGGGVLGSVLGWPGAALGIAAPHIAARFAVSKPGQAWLGNQIAPQNTRDILAQTLTQQAATQPGGIERNAAEQAAYVRKHEQDLRDLGLR